MWPSLDVQVFIKPWDAFASGGMGMPKEITRELGRRPPPRTHVLIETPVPAPRNPRYTAASFRCLKLYLFNSWLDSPGAATARQSSFGCGAFLSVERNR